MSSSSSSTKARGPHGKAAKRRRTDCVGGGLGSEPTTLNDISASNALEVAQGTRPPCATLGDLLVRFEEDTGSKQGVVGNIKTLDFEKTWLALMKQYGVYVAEMTESGVNIVKVEHRPAWDNLIFMMKSGSKELVAVPTPEAAAILSQRGFMRVNVTYYSSKDGLPAAFFNASAEEAEADTAAEEPAAVVAVTIPDGIPSIGLKSMDETAAKQITNQFEVSFPFVSLLAL
jgi:NADH dehydrogenase/NADH:ubiquinone oxidoreductase subunit G